MVSPTRPVDRRQVGGVVSTYPVLPARRGVLSRAISIGRDPLEEREGVRQESSATAPAACRSSGGRACVIARPPLGSVAGRAVWRGPAQNRERLSAKKIVLFPRTPAVGPHRRSGSRYVAWQPPPSNRVTRQMRSMNNVNPARTVDVVGRDPPKAGRVRRDREPCAVE